MLDWTGERFVPWAREGAVAYAHLHRYLWASNLVKGKRVLDLASGEGYGANMLARDAAYVCGVDIDDDAIQHARAKYVRPNLEFLKGSITEVPIRGENPFDVVVCFEAIEHIEAQEALLREVVRLVKPEGLFIVSTPNKAVYRAENEDPNPFHVKELTFDEFHALLSRHFPAVTYLGQAMHPGSSLWPIGSKDRRDVHEHAIARDGEEFELLPDDQRVPSYFVAVASRSTVAEYSGGVLIDHSDEMISDKNREVREFRAQVRQRDEALDWRKGQVESLERSNEELMARARSLQNDLGHAKQELAEIHQSRSWKWILRLRALRDRFR
jgi:SAM-dependent methyltransferase